MITVTDRQFVALATGEARVYKGRVIPIVRGGSGMEPEPVISDAPILDAPAPEPAAPAAPEAPTAADPAVATPAAPEAPAGPTYADDPAFRDAVQEAAAELLQSMQQQQPAQQQPAATPGQAVDFDEFLNPLGENYGSNLVRLLQDRDQVVLGQIKELIDPILTRAQQDQVSAGETVASQLITERWGTDAGPLSDAGKTAINALAQQFLPEENAKYGPSRIAAERAISKATDVIKQINQDALKAGGAANATELAAAAAAASTPGGGTAAIPGAEPAKSPEEALERWMARRNGTATQA